MKFSCEKTLLQSAITTASRTVAAKSSIPALEGLLLHADHQLTVSGYNMQTGIRTRLDADVTEPGSLVLSARLFGEIIRRLPDDVITFSSDKDLNVKLTCGDASYDILALSAEDYPELPEVEDQYSIRIQQNTLRSMIAQTSFAVSTDEIRPVHTGSLFEIGEEGLTVVSVDGFRLALRREAAQSPKTMRFVVPGRSLNELLKLLGEEETPVDLQVSKKHILFTIGETSLISRLLEGEFLDYNAAIPKDCSTTVKVSTRGLASSIERTSLLISDRLKSPLRVVFEDGLVKMSCSTTIGKAYDECQCETGGPRVEMGFNNRYLMDALKNSDVDMVKLEISGPLSPMKVLPLEGDSFLFLVLPMKLKNE